MIFSPTAVLVAGEDLIIRSGVGQTGQLWRYTPATGKSTLLGEGIDFRAVFGSNEIAGVLNDEVYIMTGTASASTIRTMAVNLETLETRSFQIASQSTSNPNLVLSGNGNLITMAATCGGVIVLNSAGEVIAIPGVWRGVHCMH